MSGRITEKDIISYIRKQSDFHEGLAGLGIGDDAAFLLLSSMEEGKLVISTDSVVEDVHFRKEWGSYGDAAVKLFERASSDLLSKGAHPHWVLLNMNIRPDFAENEKFWKEFVDAFCNGLKEHHIALIGGDVTRSAVNSFTATVFGNVSVFIPRKNPQIKTGDIVIVAGKTGGSSFVLENLQKGLAVENEIQEYYNRPRAQWNNQWLHDLRAKASMDQSDSIWETLEELSVGNKIEMEIHLDKIPGHDGISKQDLPPGIMKILNAAEDLAIFAILPQEAEKNLASYPDISLIGHVRSQGSSSLSFYYNGKKADTQKSETGYSHF